VHPPDPAPSRSAGASDTAGLGPVAFAIVAAILPVFLLGALSIEIRADLSYGEATAGLVLASFFAASAVVSSRIGRLIDRVGPRRGFSVALSGTAALQLLIAAVALHPAILAALAALAGICNATAQLSANVFIARDLPLHRQGVGFAVKQSAMPGAALVAGLMLPAVALTVGWRWVFVLGAVTTVAALVLVRSTLSVDVERSREEASTAANEAPPPAGALGALAVAAAFSTAAAITLGGFFVESAIDAGVAVGAAGVAFAMGSLISIGSRLGVGVLADRRQGNLLGVVAAMIALGALTSVWFTWREPAAQLIGVPLAFGAGWAWPGLFNLSVVRATPGFPGMATGITQTGTYVGAAIGPVVFGAVAETVSFAGAWWLAAGLGLSAAAAVLVGRAMLMGRGTSRRTASIGEP
jgi:MFS family permease